jgi:hypothetical protein
MVNNHFHERRLAVQYGMGHTLHGRGIALKPTLRLT